MIYEFQKENNEIICMNFPMGKCPKEIKCEDGSIAKRVFSVPSFIIKGEPVNDYLEKTRTEVLDRAGEIGMRNFVPMKNQSPIQQLKDIKNNNSFFKDKMSESNENMLKNQQRRMTEISRRNISNASVEKHMKKQEAKQKADFKSRSLSI